MGNLTISNVIRSTTADNASMIPNVGKANDPSNDQFGILLSRVGNNISDSNLNKVSVGQGDTDTEVSDVTNAYNKATGSAAKDAIKEKVDTDTSKDTRQALGDTVSKIKDKIAEDLGVSKEDLEKAMELLGLTDADLLTKGGLTQLAVELTGAEGSEALLLDEGFQQLSTDVSAILSDFTKQTGIDLDSIITFMENPEAVTEITPELQDALEQIMPETVAADEGAPLTDQPQLISPQDVADAINEDVREFATELNGETAVASSELASDDENAAEPAQVIDDPFRMVIQADTGNEAQDTESGAFAKEAQPNSANLVAEALERSESTDELFDVTASSVQQAAAATDNTLLQTEQVLAEETVTTTPSYISEDTAQSMISQLTDQVSLQLREESSTMEMTLNPATLGRLVISVTTRADEVSAQIYAQSEAVKQALESQMATLRETLSGQGYKVTAVEVAVEEQAFDRNLEERERDEQNRRRAQEEEQRGRRNLMRGELDDLQGLMTEEEELAARIMHENGNSMDLTA